MTRHSVRLCALLCLVLGLASTESAHPSRAIALADDVPAWLKQAAALPVPTYEKEVPAVVLFDESIVTVNADGHIRTSKSYAVRILTRQGAALAHAAEEYNTGSQGKIVDMKAWLIRPGGSVRKFGKDDAVDVAEQDSLYSESRTRSIAAVDQADAGMVFGYEVVSEERPFFSQTVWSFQERIPSLTSRLTLMLPTGWKATGKIFNAPAMEPKVSGNTYTWEMRNLAPIAPEPAAPNVSSLAPRVAVSYSGSSSGVQSTGKQFDGWPDVSLWYSNLSDGQSEPNEAIVQKAGELTARASTELEKIRAIAQYVQAIHYVSIQIGIGGYRPHAATDVFAKQYGDCKDKANLMRAMLKAIHIESYLVLVFSGDSTVVREEWPSPAQFNHCIIAVKLGDGSASASVVNVPATGRLLIFDPTDPYTSMGDLPTEEQGSFALVAAGPKGTLVKLPSSPPERNKSDRHIEAGSLSANGTLSATVREDSIGQAAADKRSAYKGLSPSDFTKTMEQWAGRDASGAQFAKIQPTDNLTEGRFSLELTFTAERFAQSMQNRLLVFKAITLGHDEIPVLGAATRKYPILLNGSTMVEATHIKFPEGFELDEIVSPLRISTPYASYSSTLTREPGGVSITRTLVLQTVSIPPESYAEARSFFSRIRAHEQSAIVLARK